MARKSEKSGRNMQIGDFAEKAGLSVRTVRYYEELGLLEPESHSSGGFRLYSENNFKRIRVISFLKEIGLSLTEIRRILLAKKMAGDDKNAVQFLLKIFSEKMNVVETKLHALNRIKGELANALRILRSCECCDHNVLLDAIACGDCSCLAHREAVPETFEVILQ